MATAGIGIDFGTTNSSVGLATDRQNVELVRFAQGTGTTEASRSLLYLEKGKKAWTGPAAIEQYLQADNKGLVVIKRRS